jgi:hypothetical protein
MVEGETSPQFIVECGWFRRWKNRKLLGTAYAWWHATAGERWAQEAVAVEWAHPGWRASHCPSLVGC